MNKLALRIYCLILVAAVILSCSCQLARAVPQVGLDQSPNLGRDYEVIINYCRLLMHRYPDTRQAENALTILSQVPDEYLGEYKITDEGITLKYPTQPHPMY